MTFSPGTSYWTLAGTIAPWRVVNGTKAFALSGPVSQYRYGRVHDAENWQRGWQAAYICSYQSGRIVLDCDDPAEFESFLQQTGIPASPFKVLTGRPGGYQLHYDGRHLAPEDWPRQGPIPGGDCKSAGFVPCPDSRHPNGTLYRAAGTGNPLWWDPEWLPRMEEARGRDIARRSYTGTPGSGRNNALLALKARLFREEGWFEDSPELIDAVLEANQEFEEPLDEAEIFATVLRNKGWKVVPRIPEQPTSLAEIRARQACDQRFSIVRHEDLKEEEPSRTIDNAWSEGMRHLLEAQELHQQHLELARGVRDRQEPDWDARQEYRREQREAWRGKLTMRRGKLLEKTATELFPAQRIDRSRGMFRGLTAAYEEAIRRGSPDTGWDREDFARAAGISVATAYRYCKLLDEQGWVSNGATIRLTYDKLPVPNPDEREKATWEETYQHVRETMLAVVTGPKRLSRQGIRSRAEDRLGKVAGFTVQNGKIRSRLRITDHYLDKALNQMREDGEVSRTALAKPERDGDKWTALPAQWTPGRHPEPEPKKREPQPPKMIRSLNTVSRRMEEKELMDMSPQEARDRVMEMVA